MSNIKLAAIEAFRKSMGEEAARLDIPCDIKVAPYGNDGCKITIESISYNKVKIQVEITWFGGLSKTTAEFKGLRIPSFHGVFENVLKLVEKKVFDLAMELALIGPVMEEEK